MSGGGNEAEAGGRNGSDSSANRDSDAGGRGSGRAVSHHIAGTGGAIATADQGDPLLPLIARAASDPNVDVEKFERLMAMGERREQAAAIRAFNDALANAKGDFPPILKNRVVDFTSAKGRTNYHHEDLTEISRTVDPILKRHGLSYRWRSAQAGGKLSVTCIVSHRDGYSENTTLEGAEDHSGNKNPIQAIGSAATYLQRYTLKLALGLAAAHDDDGQGAGDPAAQRITPKQAEELALLITESKADVEWILRHHNVEALSDMTARDYQQAKAGLMVRKRKLAEARS